MDETRHKLQETGRMSFLGNLIPGSIYDPLKMQSLVLQCKPTSKLKISEALLLAMAKGIGRLLPLDLELHTK